MTFFDRFSDIIDPADDYDLVELAVAKDELKIALADTTNDDWLARAVTQCSLLAQDYCKRHFTIETRRDLFLLRHDPRRYGYRTSTGLTVLQLSAWPVTNVASVTQTTPNETLALVLDTDFVVDAKNGQLTRLDPRTGSVAMAWQADEIVVEYDAGYDDVPATIVDAALRLIVNRWHSRGRDPLLLESVQPGFGTQRWWVGGPKGGGTLPAEVQGMLDLYRVPQIS